MSVPAKLKSETIRIPSKCEFDSPEHLLLKHPVTREKRERCMSLILDVLSGEGSEMEVEMKKAIDLLPDNFLFDPRSTMNVIKTCEISADDYTNLYRCVSYILFGNEKYWIAIRPAVMHTMEKDAEIFDSICMRFGEGKIDEYVERFFEDENRRPNLRLELIGIAHLFQVAIYLFHKEDISSGRRPDMVLPPNEAEKGYIGMSIHAFYLVEHRDRVCFQPFSRNTNKFYIEVKQDKSRQNETKQGTKLTKPARRSEMDTSFTNIQRIPKPGALDFPSFTCQTLLDVIDKESRNQCVSKIIDILGVNQTPLGNNLRTESSVLTDEFIDGSSRNLSEISVRVISIDDITTLHRSVSYVLFGGEQHWQVIRSAIIRYMLENEAFLSKVCKQRNIKEYCDRFYKDIYSPPNLNLELSALAQLLRVGVYVFDKAGLQKGKEPRVFIPYGRKKTDVPAKRAMFLLENQRENKRYFQPFVRFNNVFYFNDDLIEDDDDDVEIPCSSTVQRDTQLIEIDSETQAEKPTPMIRKTLGKAKRPIDLSLNLEDDAPVVKKPTLNEDANISRNLKNLKTGFQRLKDRFSKSDWKRMTSDRNRARKDQDKHKESAPLKTRRPSYLNDDDESPTVKKSLLDYEEEDDDVVEIERYDPLKPAVGIYSDSDSDSELMKPTFLTKRLNEKLSLSKRRNQKDSEDILPTSKPKYKYEETRVSLSASSRPDFQVDELPDLLPDNERSPPVSTIYPIQPSIRHFINENDRRRIVDIIWDDDERLVQNSTLPDVECESEMFESVPIQDDGNSLYRSISYLVFGRQEYYHVFKRRLIEFMSDVMNEYALNRVCKKHDSFTAFIRTYLKVMNESGKPATKVEVAGAALMLNIPIYVFEENEINEEPDLFLPDTDDMPQRALILHRVHDFHFQPVVKYHIFYKKHKISKVHSRDAASHRVKESKRQTLNQNQDVASWETVHGEVNLGYDSGEEFTTTLTTRQTSEAKQRRTVQDKVDSRSDDENPLNHSPVASTSRQGTTESMTRRRLFTDDSNVTTKKTLSTEKQSSLITDVQTRVDHAELAYTFDENWNSKSDHFTIHVSGGSTARQQYEYAVKSVFKKIEKSVPVSIGLDDDVQTFETKDFLRERNYARLVEMFNRQFRKDVIPERLFTHFKRIVRKTPTSELFSVRSENDRINEHKRRVIDMRMRLQPFECRFSEKHNGRAVSGQLKLACFAVSNSEHAREHDFGYFHTGGKDGTWTPIPINIKVYDIQKHLKPGQSLMLNDKIFYLADDHLNAIELFCQYAIPKQFQIPETRTASEKLMLARLSNGQLCILDKDNSQFALCDDESVQTWQRFKKVNVRKLQQMNSQQFEFSSKRLPSEVLILPEESKENQVVVSDMFTKKDMRIPLRHEFVIKPFDMEDTFEVTLVKAGLLQVTFKTFKTSLDDSKFLLIDAELLKRHICDIKDKNDDE